MRLTGTVRLVVTVAADGKVTRTEVSGGNPVLAQSAVDAVNKSKWQPGTEETKEIVEVKFQPETD